jgi:STAM-binding protein
MRFMHLGFSESGEVLREVRVPRSIVEDFLAIAQSNTDRNLETCGIVAGNLVSSIIHL